MTNKIRILIIILLDFYLRHKNELFENLYRVFSKLILLLSSRVVYRLLDTNLSNK